MFTTNSNRAWKRTIAASRPNRAARRNAARIVAAFGVTQVTTETGTVKLYSRPYVTNGHAVRTASPEAGSIGPFKTMRAALYYVSNPQNSVAACERLSK